MSFLLVCPNCGSRNVSEFRFGGELTARPTPEAPADEWAGYFYNRRNTAGPQREWWYHSLGCRRWFVALRDTITNTVMETAWPNEVPRDGAAEGSDRRSGAPSA